MGKILFYAVATAAAVAGLAGCERLDNDIDKHGGGDPPLITLEDVALLLTGLEIGKEQMSEVADAVYASSDNGYDEEYTMRDLFRTPGAGVGDDRLSGATRMYRKEYESPLRDLIKEHLEAGERAALADTAYSAGAGLPENQPFSRSHLDGSFSAEEYISALESSDIQIYWPFSEQWDGESSPVITFDPADGSEANIGYMVVRDSLGNRKVEEVVVDEAMAMKQPVWVVNRNDDAGYVSLEILRKQDPEWGTGGGSVTVRPQRLGPVGCRSEDSGPLRTLVLKDFTMLRNMDTWFGGASEFFVKIGSVEDFTASTEAELKLYNPSVTDFMITVKRKHAGEPRPFNAVLVSDWTDQLEQCAFMITEDDGGTRTSWKCSAVVKIASKSYGFEINLPFNTRDDIIWRGQLSRRYIEMNDNATGHFGNVDLTFEIREY